jgi:hypothetical protein
VSRSSLLRLALAFAGGASAALSRAVAAAPEPVAPDRQAIAAATIANPVTLQKDYDLDFGLATVTTAGTMILDPNSDALTTTGGVLAVGGSPHAANFKGIAPTGNVVIIRLPKDATTLTRVGGTETMTVDRWTLDGTTRRNVLSKTAFDFRVGGTLHVNANQVEGIYVGTFVVDVQYP